MVQASLGSRCGIVHGAGAVARAWRRSEGVVAGYAATLCVTGSVAWICVRHTNDIWMEGDRWIAKWSSIARRDGRCVRRVVLTGIGFKWSVAVKFYRPL